MARNRWQDAWEAAHPDKVKAYNAKYEAAHQAERQAAKRKWWRENKGRYGTWENYIQIMRLTGGVGYEAGWRKHVPGLSQAMKRARRTNKRRA